MLTNLYVIDYVLKDLDGSKDKLDRIFGTEAALDPSGHDARPVDCSDLLSIAR